MKKIKDLNVTVTYIVGIGDIEVNDEVFKQLNEIADKGVSIDGLSDMKYPEACDWLRDNIKEADCCDLEYQINDLD